MRRPTFVALALGAAFLATGGCASSSHAPAQTLCQQRAVSLSGGDSLGRRLHRDSPEFALSCTTPQTDLANAEPDADGE